MLYKDREVHGIKMDETYLLTVEKEHYQDGWEVMVSNVISDRVVYLESCVPAENLEKAKETALEHWKEFEGSDRWQYDVDNGNTYESIKEAERKAEEYKKGEFARVIMMSDNEWAAYQIAKIWDDDGKA